jgi:hypothetical protein
MSHDQIKPAILFTIWNSGPQVAVLFPPSYELDVANIPYTLLAAKNQQKFFIVLIIIFPC